MDDGFPDDDIRIEILSRLPTKLLLQSKQVSKRWRQIITDKTFILVQSERSKPVLSGFFLQEKFLWCKDDIETVNYIPVDSEQITVHKSVFDFLPEKVVLMASTNGLVCCRSCNKSSHPLIYICNPSNKKWISLEGPDAIGKTIAIAPMGISGDFKLVHVHHTEAECNETLGDDDSDDDESRLFCFSFETYHSITGKWTKSQDICYSKHSLFRTVGVYCNGVIHWLTDGEEIIVFDLEAQSSRSVSTPATQIPFEGLASKCIGEWSGQLHYVHLSSAGIQVYVLENYNEMRWELTNFIPLTSMQKENPQILYNIERKMGNQIGMMPWMEPLAFYEGLLLFRLCSKIYLYPLETMQIKELCTLTMLGPNSLNYPIVLPYNLSLVHFQSSSTV